MGFNDIANRTHDAVEAPKAPPQGTWLMRIVSGKTKEAKSDNGPRGRFVFTLGLVQAGDDVSGEELDDFGSLEGARVYHDIAIWDETSLWPVKRFLMTAGVEFEEGEALRDAAARATGHEVTGYVQYRPNEKDPENPYVDVTNIVEAA